MRRPATTAETLVFNSSATQFSPVNDFTAGTSFAAIQLSSARARPYVMTGNAMVLGSGGTAITNSVGTNTPRSRLTVNLSTISIATGTVLNLGQTGTKSLSTWHAAHASNAGTLTINSVISGAGGLTHTGAGPRNSTAPTLTAA